MNYSRHMASPTAESAQSTDTSAISITFTPQTAVRLVMGVMLVVVGTQVLGSVPEATMRLVMGLMFAFALDPVVARIARKLGCTRAQSVGLVGILATTIFSGIVAMVGPAAVAQAARTSREIPTTLDNLSTLPLLGGFIERFEVRDQVMNWMAELPAQLSDQSIANTVDSLVGGLTSGFLVIVIGIAALLDGPILIRRLGSLVPAREYDRAAEVGRVFYRTISSYFAGSLLIATLAATYVFVVGISLGVPLMPIAALWVIIVSFIPQINGLLIASMFGLLALGKSPGTAVLCLLLYWVYMVFENHILQPVVVGNAVNLSMAATMLAVLLGGTMFGVPGAILGAPLVGTVKGIWLEVMDPKTAAKAHEEGSLRQPTLTGRLRKLGGRFFERLREDKQPSSKGKNT